ncbi:MULTISPECIES: pyridoxal phosphate-dependent aminotransferase [Bacillaceae]|uniref:Aminotransferase n=1 Tax=Gottfriedia luciferensis TaxID=178774 RepID=A0ABX2ZYT4_9BACI|nr:MULTISPECIES: pyridoxal phosphate-dependent aminotransferase [Bacillaceae]ODG93702.1 aspartate aminotransferase [Gottfriedia luciferensis]PGZ91137.1 pyridoxal phosphate-dependent aminotransferase [Bacillus sp. AFS029533]SFC25995.1 aspartate aminotransferase [Bacillus sp. UNCCL81]
MKLAKRVSALTPSTTLAITAKAKEMKDQGIDVIGLGAGEPDFNTPVEIIEEAYSAMLKGQTKYTPSNGLPALRKTICDKLLKDQGLTYSPGEVVVTNGAKHALYTLFQAILDPGNEVIIPTPYWVSYPEQVILAEGVPVFIEGYEHQQFKVTPEQIEAAITENTKAIIINSPSNPTGMIYNEQELKAIGEICLKHDVLIVSDEIYEKLVYDGAKHVSIASLSPELKEQTIIINGVSKSHSMTGWRIGYAVGNKEIINAMTNLASHSTSNPTTMAQIATIKAYELGDGPVEEMRVAFEDRLNKTYERLISIPGFSCVKPNGAFYLFPNVTEAAKMAGYQNVDEFSTELLEKANVAVIPGSGFGSPDNIRLSYATSQVQLDKALERIEQFMKASILS